MGLHPFTTYVLRNYYRATGWNEDNLYSNLTRSSDAILDFPIPRGLQFSISKSPNSLFRTTYSINALPSLTGSVGYIFSSCALNLQSSGEARFKDMVERFRIYEMPRRPEGKEEEWLAGKRVDTKDFLLSGLLYIPERRLDSFYSTRLSPTLQVNISAITRPHPSTSYSPNSSTSSHQHNPYADGTLSIPSSSEFGTGSLLFSLQHDTGRWGTEYTWDSDGSVWGVRVLRNFGKLASGQNGVGQNGNLGVNGVNEQNEKEEVKMRRTRVDQEEVMEGGLRGRISAGAEFYISPENTAGVSMGVRFSTLPDASPPSTFIEDSLSSSSTLGTSLGTSASSSAISPSPSTSLPSPTPPPKPSFTPSQPPTTLTALFNPLTGHFISAYAARVSRDLTLCSRFSFNINSYESEWMVGGEWWVRRKSGSVGSVEVPVNVKLEGESSRVGSDADSLVRLRDEESGVDLSSAAAAASSSLSSSTSTSITTKLVNETQGVIKAKLSTSADIAFLWEGRLQNMLVSLGVMTNVANRSRGTALGLELAYFSSESDL